ncbi:MAG: hypothetical protein EPN86_03600 [Nanoarchaeota archaeon]|nr:MAG: hypothetical protein EPN86_03600 [Nanoarchaeota archaeon]
MAMFKNLFQTHNPCKKLVTFISGRDNSILKLALNRRAASVYIIDTTKRNQGMACAALSADLYSFNAKNVLMAAVV